MNGGIRGLSFHSVKGGVGKSTLAVHAALALARKHIEADVWLVDLDLTGTSLADGLPLRAPDLGEPLSLIGPPVRAPLDRTETLRRIERRQLGWEDFRCATGVAFLNDWLLFQPDDWAEGLEPPIASVSWTLEGAPANLHVLPSSALPADLEQTIPAVFDEEYTAFFEARLEHLLVALHAASRRGCHVVFDVPPTIPGLSRAVLGAALRLSRSPESRIPLSLDGDFPPPLDDLPFRWTACFVATLDRPDVRAIARWLAKVRPDEEGVIRPVLNRTAPQQGPSERAGRLRSLLGLEEPPFDGSGLSGAADDTLFSGPLLGAAWVADDETLSIFGGEERCPGPHPAIDALLSELDGT